MIATHEQAGAFVHWQRAVEYAELFASSDETRPHLYSPALWEKHVVATDGHTMCVVRTGDIPSDRVGKLANGGSEQPPPWTQVVPKRFQPWGSFSPGACPACEFYPKTWNVTVEWLPCEPGHPHGAHKLHAKRPFAEKDPRRITFRQGLPVVENAPIGPWFPDIRVPEPCGIDSAYLWRVAELYTNPPTSKRERSRDRTIYVFGEDKLSPFVFTTEPTPRTFEDLLALPSFCLVMPVRV
jgi:hypothetical protein